jgi:hypothetical protein
VAGVAQVIVFWVPTPCWTIRLFISFEGGRCCSSDRFLGSYTVLDNTFVPKFRRKVLPPSSGWLNKKHVAATAYPDGLRTPSLDSDNKLQVPNERSLILPCCVTASRSDLRSSVTLRSIAWQLPTFRDILLVPSVLALKMEPIGCHEASVTTTLCCVHIPEERRSHLHSGRGLKSCLKVKFTNGQGRL